MIDDDPRLLKLIAMRETHCILRKQNQRITAWFRERYPQYNRMWERADRDTPEVKMVMERLFTVIKFVLLPNDESRKLALIDSEWPKIQADVARLAGG